MPECVWHVGYSITFSNLPACINILCGALRPLVGSKPSLFEGFTKETVWRDNIGDSHQFYLKQPLPTSFCARLLCQFMPNDIYSQNVCGVREKAELEKNSGPV